VPRVLLGVGLVALIAAVVSIAVGEGGPSRFISGRNDVQPLFAGLPQDGAYLGAGDAPVTVTVFNDLQCLGCEDFEFDVVDPLIEPYIREGDELRLEFRHFSLAPNDTTLAAIGAEAAGLQGYQWQFIDTFFRNQDVFRTQGVSDELLREVAEATGEIDLDQWQADYDSPATKELVVQDAMLADELKLPGGGPAVAVDGPGGLRQLTTDQDEDAPTLAEVEGAIDQVSR
jgi:protein-disulfide isomerase